MKERAVCGIDYVTRTHDNTTAPEAVVPIAGDFIHEGRGWNPKYSLLRKSGSHADADREGLLVDFDGGMSADKVPQKAIIEFECDPKRTGLEGDESDDRPKDSDRRRDDKDEDKKDDEKDDKDEKPDGKSLTLLSYKEEKTDNDKTVGVLRLQWKTKHACERSVGKDPDKTGSSWGFFTWFLIM